MCRTVTSWAQEIVVRNMERFLFCILKIIFHALTGVA